MNEQQAIACLPMPQPPSGDWLDVFAEVFRAKIQVTAELDESFAIPAGIGYIAKTPSGLFAIDTQAEESAILDAFWNNGSDWVAGLVCAAAERLAAGLSKLLDGQTVAAVPLELPSGFSEANRKVVNGFSIRYLRGWAWDHWELHFAVLYGTNKLK